ncbi:hypothetical protein THAOC_10172, partial [Thalassiosira oceanica]
PASRSEQTEQKRTDEERLLDEVAEERMMEEIAKQKELIDAPPGDTEGGIAHRVSQDNKLGQLEFKYQFLVEKERLARVLLKFQELYGDIYSEPCLICLDDIHVHASSANFVERFLCCGGFICKSCSRDLRESGVGLDRCPLCRESLDDKTAAEKTATLKLMALAKRGVIWAQSHVGRCMIYGVGGFEKQVQTGVEWVNKAAAQNYPPALYELSKIYRSGIASELEKSEEKANELLLESANLGYSFANTALAKVCFDTDQDEAYFRASVAFALDNTNEQAAFILGGLHYDKEVPEPSLYLACYFRNIAACGDTDGAACYYFGESLLHLDNHLYGENATNGFNVWPAAFFWMRKSRDLGFNDARELLKQWETIEQDTCGNCGKEVQSDMKYKQCSKCRAQWYCSKECQIEAWRAGHKKDCKRATILKFEDYLNAE